MSLPTRILGFKYECDKNKLDECISDIFGDEGIWSISKTGEIFLPETNENKNGKYVLWIIKISGETYGQQIKPLFEKIYSRKLKNNSGIDIENEINNKKILVFLDRSKFVDEDSNYYFYGVFKFRKEENQLMIYERISETFFYDVCQNGNFECWEKQNGDFETKLIKSQFEKYLTKKGYKAKTNSGKPSTVYDYIKRIDKVCSVEKYRSWEELRNNIDICLKEYDTNGKKYDIGQLSNRAVINALKRFKEFMEQL